MKMLARRLLGGRLQLILIACFSLVAALTVALNTLTALRVVTNYLDQAMERRVSRDMDLAQAFYDLKLAEVSSISQRLAQDPQVIHTLTPALEGSDEAKAIIDEELSRKITLPALGGTHLLVLLDQNGEISAGRTLTGENALSPPLSGGNWSSLRIVQDALASGLQQAGAEVIPAANLADIGLEQAAFIEVVETPKAAAQTFDAREGGAGLALTTVTPIFDEEGNPAGAAVAAHLFNNDFSLVDEIRAVAGVDTVTVFFGDLRVSTNVMDEEGQRAVGTRLSDDVYDVVLRQGLDYDGRAFVVNDWFITRYTPLRDHLGQVVGSLYVGARESTFKALVSSFYSRVGQIALISMILAALVAIPIARLITQPIDELVKANRRMASGDMAVRVRPNGSGELAELGRSFNIMAETLESTQQELSHKERLASMGQLAAGVAHEINNPLGTILLFSNIMLHETGSDGPWHEDLQIIIDETVRCKDIVADLLNFARQQEVLAQETDLNELLEQVVALAASSPIFEPVRFVFDLAPGLPPVQADPAQLKQVFLNLINNAAEAMPSGGTITLATRLRNHDSVEISIADTGAGIPAEDLRKLFTPFFTTKPPGKGTGLGLSIVYGIIKMHSGQIMVDSQEGKGTIFKIVLPLELPARRETLIGAQAEFAGT